MYFNTVIKQTTTSTIHSFNKISNMQTFKQCSYLTPGLINLQVL